MTQGIGGVIKSAYTQHHKRYLMSIIIIIKEGKTEGGKRKKPVI
jgi:hypothetical protein